MKRITFVLIIALLLTSFLTSSCVSGRSYREIQEDFNQDAIYFIQNDGQTLIKYLDNDTSLTLREKQATRRRLANLKLLIEQLEEKQK